MPLLGTDITPPCSSYAKQESQIRIPSSKSGYSNKEYPSELILCLRYEKLTYHINKRFRNVKDHLSDFRSLGRRYRSTATSNDFHLQWDIAVDARRDAGLVWIRAVQLVALEWQIELGHPSCDVEDVVLGGSARHDEIGVCGEG